MQLLIPISYLFCFLVSRFSVLAFIPATATNDTNFAFTQGLNWSDTSSLQLRWWPDQAYKDLVSFQLSASNTLGLSKGALVHFSEANVNETTPPTRTPFIALVNCDGNATSASEDVDIFTLARDMGATAALLYSTRSQACVINAEYTDARYYEQILDIYTTKNLASSQLLESHFSEVTAPIGQNDSAFWSYDSQRLNSSFDDILANVDSGNDTSSLKLSTRKGYLFMTLRAYNSTDADDDDSNDSGSAGSGDNTGNQGGSSPGHLSMIVLYAVTGSVSGLFIAVIIAGAIRAMRHPERYGNRRMHNGFVSMPHARALGQAILDTFPVFKFGSSRPPLVNKDVESDPDISTLDHDQENKSSTGAEQSRGAAATSRHQARASAQSLDVVEMDDWLRVSRGLGKSEIDLSLRDPTTSNQPATALDSHQQHGSGSSSSISAGASRPENSRSSNPPEQEAGPSSRAVRPRAQQSPKKTEPDVVPPGIGHETCPICIVDFEEGEDLRMLPCEGKHVFHKKCVDPWLLELSSSCPICRHDFLALENLLSGSTASLNDEDEEDEEHSYPPHEARHSGTPRFSRYLRFARRRHRATANRGQNESEPTTPTAPDPTTS